MPEFVDALSVVPLGAADWTEAARLLEQAVKAGNQDPQAAYLLALCYKHLGRTADARHVLSRVAAADANVLLQRGILAFADRDFAQASQEFSLAREQEPASYPAAYNLLLARLCQGQKEQCVLLIPKIIPLAMTPQQQRFLAQLRALIMFGTTAIKPAGTPEGWQDQGDLLGSMSAEEEALLVEFLGGLGSFEVVYPLLNQLMVLRPDSSIAYGAYFGAALVQGKLLMDRFLWEDAYALLAPLARKLEGDAVMSLVALHGMLGTCSCMLQDFERGAGYFRSAHEVFHRARAASAVHAVHGAPRQFETHLNSQGIDQGAWLEQNLALAYEWQNKLDKAEQHWNRYFDYLENSPPPAPPSQGGEKNRPRPEGGAKLSSPPYEGGDGGGRSTYLANLAFEGMSRLADLFIKKEKWKTALGFLQRAQRVRPTDNDTLERLFHLYTQLKKSDEAKRILRRLREVRPNDPQVELFEIDVREVRAPEDIEKTIGDVRRILQKNPGDMRVEERAGIMINTLVPALERLGEQYTGQINKVIDQMRRLPSYQINWPVVRNVMHELEDKFFQLRRVAQKSLSLLTNEDLRRDINSLVTHCDRKIDQCHSLGE